MGDVTSLLKEACKATESGSIVMDNPEQSAEPFIALGVVSNISRSYGEAIDAFRSALRIRPNDSALWNKLGASLANSGSSEHALTCYHYSLELKPNCSRTWSNLAIAHSNLGDSEDALRFYLSSLALSNPTKLGTGSGNNGNDSSSSSNLWSFIHSNILSLASNDKISQEEATRLLKACTDRDLKACLESVSGCITGVEDLPEMKAELGDDIEEILGRLPTGEGYMGKA